MQRRGLTTLGPPALPCCELDLAVSGHRLARMMISKHEAPSLRRCERITTRISWRSGGRSSSPPLFYERERAEIEKGHGERIDADYKFRQVQSDSTCWPRSEQQQQQQPSPYRPKWNNRESGPNMGVGRETGNGIVVGLSTAQRSTATDRQVLSPQEAEPFFSGLCWVTFRNESHENHGERMAAAAPWRRLAPPNSRHVPAAGEAKQGGERDAVRPRPILYRHSLTGADAGTWSPASRDARSRSSKQASSKPPRGPSRAGRRNRPLWTASELSAATKLPCRTLPPLLGTKQRRRPGL